VTFIARVRPEATQDVDDRAAYYEREERGFGVRFILVVSTRCAHDDAFSLSAGRERPAHMP
jgi:hypothetical protein